MSSSEVGFDMLERTHQECDVNKELRDKSTPFFLSNDVFPLGIHKQTCEDTSSLKGQPPEEFHKPFFFPRSAGKDQLPVQRQGVAIKPPHICWFAL